MSFTHVIYIEDLEKYFVDDIITIALGGDLHKGKDTSSRHDWLDFLRLSYLKILMGDLLETIGPNDRRFNIGEHGANPVMQAYFELEDEIEQYSETIALLLRGNHEQAMFRSFGNFYKQDIRDENGKLKQRGLCPANDILYGGSVCFLIFTNKDGTKMSRWQLIHPGKGGINYRAGEIKRIKTNEKLKSKMLQSHISDSDLYAMGHTHQLVVCEPDFQTKLKFDGNRMKLSKVADNPRWYCCTGSFVRVYDEGVDGDYAEDWAVKPSDIGYIEVKMNRDLDIVSVDERKLNAI